MNDNHVEAQPGDNADNGADVESVELSGAASRPLEMPRRADLTRSDQARRSRPGRPESRPGSEIVEAASKPEATPLIPAPRETIVSQARPIAQSRGAAGDKPIPGLERQEEQEQAPAPSRLASPHPLARLRLGEPSTGRRRIGLPSFGGSARQSPAAGDTMPSRPRQGRPGLRRPRLRRPSLRTAFAFTGIVATVAVVASLLMTLPTHPGAPASTGSIYQISWRSAANPPAARFDFGPYFTSFDNDLLMLGTNGSTTTVWSSSDGSTWSQVSSPGAFDISGRRFVAQGLADDGSGGLVVVGNSIGSSSTDVAAMAWRSRDGKTWVTTEVDSSRGQEMIGGAVARPGAVVTAGNGVAWFSPDGLRWTPYVLPGAQNYIPRAVGSWDGGFVIVALWNGEGGPRSAVWYSTTGRDWTQAATSLDGFDARGVAGSGGRIVAVGSDTGAKSQGLAASWSSTDGKTWVKSTAPSDQPQTAMDGVTVVDGTWVAVGAPDTNAAGTASQVAQPGLSVWVSEEGTLWLPIITNAQPLTHGRMAAVAGRLVLVGGSSDGQGVLAGNVVLGPARTPSPSPSAAAQFALSLKAGDTPMIADVGVSDTLGPAAASDDRFFTFVTQPAGTSIWSSANGSLWAQELGPDELVTTGNKGRPVVLQAINDGHGGVIAIGRVTSSAGDTGTIWRLPKGGTWHQASLGDTAPPEFSSISAGPTGFVVASDEAGGSTVMYSADGETWSAAAIAVASGYVLTVGTYKFGFVATGSDPTRLGVSTAWTSPDGRTWTIRPDWHLPVNVTQVFGTSNGLVALTAGSGIAPSASASALASPAASTAAEPTPAAKGSSTPPTSWWWSPTGVNWQQTGLETSCGNWAFVNGEILALDVPANLTSNWTTWSSGDGQDWLRPASSPLAFGGSNSCRIASIGSQIVVVGWEAKGQLKDYYGTFVGH